MKKIGTYKKYAIYEDSEGHLGAGNGENIVPLVRQTEQCKWIPMTYSDLFYYGEEGNFREAIKDLISMGKIGCPSV